VARSVAVAWRRSAPDLRQRHQAVAMAAVHASEVYLPSEESRRGSARDPPRLSVLVSQPAPRQVLHGVQHLQEMAIDALDAKAAPSGSIPPGREQVVTITKWHERAQGRNRRWCGWSVRRSQRQRLSTLVRLRADSPSPAGVTARRRDQKRSQGERPPGRRGAAWSAGPAEA